MSKDILKQVQQLINSNFGDPGRLKHIHDSIINGKTLYDSDQKYLENIILKYQLETNSMSGNIRVNEKEFDSSSQNVNIDRNPYEENIPINNLEKKLDDTWDETNDTKKGINSQARPYILHEYKSESTTLILSIVVGLFGVMGVGHIYIGKIKRGLMAMMIGFSLWMILIVPFSMIGVYEEIDDKLMLNDINYVDYSNIVNVNNGLIILLAFVFAFVVVIVGYIVLYTWQILDSRKLCKIYNLHMEEYGKQPW